MDMKPKLLAASGQEGMGSGMRFTRWAQSKYWEEYELSSEAQRIRVEVGRLKSRVTQNCELSSEAQGIRVEAGRLKFEVTFWDETGVSSKVMAATE